MEGRPRVLLLLRPLPAAVIVAAGGAAAKRGVLKGLLLLLPSRAAIASLSSRMRASRCTWCEMERGRSSEREGLVTG